jgi:hypothetical protein
MTKISVTEVPKAKFWPGDLYFTAAADRELVREDIIAAVKRHCAGDWGDVCPEDREANETALAEGGRLFSVYQDRQGVKFWIITERDRSVTNVELHISRVMLSLQKC